MVTTQLLADPNLCEPQSYRFSILKFHSSSCGMVVEHLARNPGIEGLNPANIGRMEIVII
jgi:hypothetical protein